MISKFIYGLKRIVVGSDDDMIMTISKDKKEWWVHGYTNGLDLLNPEKFEDLKGVKNE